MGRNSNNWNIQLSHSAFSVFAASHFVPTIMGNDNKTGDITSARQGKTMFTYFRLDA